MFGWNEKRPKTGERERHTEKDNKYMNRKSGSVWEVFSLIRLLVAPAPCRYMPYTQIYIYVPGFSGEWFRLVVDIIHVL